MVVERAKTVLEIAYKRISRGNPHSIPTFSLPNFDDNFEINKGITNSKLNKEFKKISRIIHFKFKLMPVEIFNKNQQASGSFNNGEILENKPIGFPQDGGVETLLKSFFIGHMLGLQVKKSTIGLHPHQGFEICSFVLKGNINHLIRNKINGYL